jgi:hypothetical protein
MMGWKKILSIALCTTCIFNAGAQDTIRYTGKTLVNVDYHHGQLTPAVGVHNIQVMRASREHPDQSDGFGWTYNHAPMLAYHNNTFYLEYLSNPVGEHVQPGQTLLVTSKDGYTWSKPVLLFPPYKIPDGTTKPGSEKKAQNISAVMHQRMGFYVSKSKKLLALGYYGIALDEKDDPNDGNGIGRVVREILPDGKFGPIYFIRYNHAFNASNTSYPPYTQSKDNQFVAACNELLAQPLLTQQWNEEADRNDPLITLKNEYKAFCFYHLPDKRVVGLWKHALTSISTDEGKSWKYNPLRAPGFVNSNAKIWGQRTSDGKYATVYNPSEFRWPLAISVSDDGLNYKNLLLVNGEISSMRYGGNYKSYGPQYVRGISEGDGTPPDGRMWVSYSMNKEDIWVASIPVPVTDKVEADVNDVFFPNSRGSEVLQNWNIYSPLMAQVKMMSITDNYDALLLSDGDPFDYAKAERVVPVAKKMIAEFEISASQDNYGLLNIEFQDNKGNTGIRIALDSAGDIKTKAGYRYRGLGKYEKLKQYKIIVELNTATRMFTVNINGKQGGNNLFFAPLESVSRIVFRTGEVRRFPDADTPTDQMYDLPNTGSSVPGAWYFIYSLKTKKLG